MNVNKKERAFKSEKEFKYRMSSMIQSEKIKENEVKLQAF